MGASVVDGSRLGIEHDHAGPTGRMPEVFALFFHFLGIIRIILARV